MCSISAKDDLIYLCVFFCMFVWLLEGGDFCLVVFFFFLFFSFSEYIIFNSTFCEYRGHIVWFYNPHIIYIDLKRTMTQLLPPGSTLVDLYSLDLFSALVLYFVGTSILDLSLYFSL